MSQSNYQGNSMITVGLSKIDDGSCANLNSSDWTIQCDLGKDHVSFRLIGSHYSNNTADLSIPKTDELLALRRAVFSGEANPALLADMLEENIEQWFHCANPQKVVDTLRQCWDKQITLKVENSEPEVEYVEKEVTEPIRTSE